MDEKEYRVVMTFGENYEFAIYMDIYYAGDDVTDSHCVAHGSSDTINGLFHMAHSKLDELRSKYEKF